MAATHYSQRSVVSGSLALRRLLKKELPKLARSPILLVSSGEAPALSLSYPNIQMACEAATFVASMEMGMRTVPFTITSAYPTLEDVHRAKELIQRTGATSVMGVGSGAAIDLAKAVFTNDSATKMEQLVLAPATWGSSFAAGSSRSMLLDPIEETLALGNQCRHNDDKSAVHIALDPNLVCDNGPPIQSTDAIFASIAIAMDSIYSTSSSSGKVNRRSEVIASLTHGLYALEETGNNPTCAHEHTVKALYHAGELLTFGTESSEPRNIALALLSSILPISFPQASVLTFIASLLPGLCDTFEDHSLLASLSDDDEIGNLMKKVESHSMKNKIPSLSSLAIDSTSAIDASGMLKEIHSNQAVWNCYDADDAILEEVLHRSLSR